MRFPKLLFVMGYAGLIPFLLGPAWLSVAPQSAPPWLDPLWRIYVAMIASFMSGTFWGFALPASEGPAGQFALVLSVILMLASFGTMALPVPASLWALIGVFVAQLLADLWRDRTLGTVPGYTLLRASLTIGAVIALAWRLAL